MSESVFLQECAKGWLEEQGFFGRIKLTLSPYDILWAVLAVTSAWKMTMTGQLRG